MEMSDGISEMLQNLSYVVLSHAISDITVHRLTAFTGHFEGSRQYSRM